MNDDDERKVTERDFSFGIMLSMGTGLAIGAALSLLSKQPDTILITAIVGIILAVSLYGDEPRKKP